MGRDSGAAGSWTETEGAAVGVAIVAIARAEVFEEALERGEVAVLHTEEAEEARDALCHAIQCFERAKGSATTAMEEDAEDVSPLVGIFLGLLS